MTNQKANQRKSYMRTVVVDWEEKMSSTSAIYCYLFFAILLIIFTIFYNYNYYTKVKPKKKIDKLKENHDIPGLINILDRNNSEWEENYCIDAIIEIANGPDKLLILTEYMNRRLFKMRLLGKIDISQVIKEQIRANYNPVKLLELIIFYYQNGKLTLKSLSSVEFNNLIRQMLLTKDNAEIMSLIISLSNLKIISANQWIELGIGDAIKRFLQTEEWEQIQKLYKSGVVSNDTWVDLGLPQTIDILINKVIDPGDPRTRIGLFRIVVGFHEVGVLNSSQRSRLISRKVFLKEVIYTYTVSGSVSYEEVYGYKANGEPDGALIRHEEPEKTYIERLGDFWPKDNFSTPSRWEKT